jgi:hypothetical protein
MRGIPFRATRYDIQRVCALVRAYQKSCCGLQWMAPILPYEVEIVFKENGIPSGEARLTFHNYDDALKVMEKNRQYMGDRWIDLHMETGAFAVRVCASTLWSRQGNIYQKTESRRRLLSPRGQGDGNARHRTHGTIVIRAKRWTRTHAGRCTSLVRCASVCSQNDFAKRKNRVTPRSKRRK